MKFPKDGWTDNKGRSAESFAELALKRAAQSDSPFWRVKPDSWVPIRVQYFFWKAILWARTILNALV